MWEGGYRAGGATCIFVPFRQRSRLLFRNSHSRSPVFPGSRWQEGKGETHENNTVASHEQHVTVALDRLRQVMLVSY